MRKNCENCGGRITYSPKDKGNKCENCGTIYPVEFNYEFNKNSIENMQQFEELTNEMKTIKCESCGANIVLSKYQIQANCPYCGNPGVVELKNDKIMHIDSIIPFQFDKEEALVKFKSNIRHRFYANAKIFKDLTVEDIKGVYINAFVFDLNTSSMYSGVFSYTKTIEDKNGNKQVKTYFKNVNGEFSKNYKNISIEANSNIEQSEFVQILPFEYASSVKFKMDFMHGYMLEYQDKIFNECFEEAKRIVKKDIEVSLLKKYNCDNIISLTLNTNYLDKKYNYCLLPVYFVSKEYKNKNYKALMNGQTGKLGKLPTSVGRVILTILLVCIPIVLAIVLFVLLSNM